MHDPLKDLHNYSNDMTISQVVKFFERKGIHFTKTMIQNYVRVGVLAPPDVRAYHAEHLKTLVLIEYLKPVYSLDEIRALFRTFDAPTVYDAFLRACADAENHWSGNDPSGPVPLIELAAFCVTAKRLTLEAY